MKQNINEIKKMQRIAGLITESEYQESMMNESNVNNSYVVKDEELSDEDGDFYLPHVDASVYTVISYFWKEPKKFTGGNLKLKDFDIEIEVKNNMVIYMPSVYVHEVTPIVMEEKSLGYGRYSMSQFLFVRNSAND